MIIGETESTYREAAAEIPFAVLAWVYAGLLSVAVTMAAFVIPRHIPVIILGIVCIGVSLLSTTRRCKKGHLRAYAIIVCSVIHLLTIRLYFPYFFVVGGLPEVSVVFVLAIQIALIALFALPFASLDVVGLISVPITTADMYFLYSRIQGEAPWLFAAVLGVAVLFGFLYNQVIRTNSEKLRVRHALQETRELNERLATVSANLMEQRQQQLLANLSASIAHEINNPLNHMIGNLEFLERDVRSLYERASEKKDRSERMSCDDEYREAKSILESIGNGAEVIASVVSRLRELFKPSGSAPRTVRIKELVHTVDSAIPRTACQAVKLSVDALGELAVVSHPGDLYAIIANVLRNAYDAIDEDGSVSVTATDAGDNIEIMIHDTGCGIPAESIDRVFDPFYTTKEKSGGFGIGLALCRSLIDKMGGRISIESREQSGTSVKITIPKESS